MLDRSTKSFLAYIFIALCLASTTSAEEKDEEEIVIVAKRPMTASSDQTIRDQDFKYFPKHTASDLMRLVPGLHISQHTGGAKAHQIFLRGFDAEHGQDIAVYLDGIPINEVSHVHGQGYLDLHFLIPEVIKRIHLIKGPYDSRLGNFATAGAIQLESAFQRSHPVTFKIGLGSFNQQSILSEFSFGNSQKKIYLALQGEQTDGYTEPGHLGAVRAFAHARLFELDGNTLDLIYAGYRVRSQAADTLPESLIQQGVIDRFQSLDDSCRVDVDRHLIGLNFSSPRFPGELKLAGYFNFKDTIIFSNYTYYYFNETRGDQLEQSDFRYYGGVNSSYSFFSNLGQDIDLISVIGLNWRADAIWQAQANTVKRVRYNLINKYDIFENNIGLFLHEKLLLSSRWILVGGVRYDVNLVDLQGTQDTKKFDIYTNQVVHINNQPRDSLSFANAISPKISLIYSANDYLKMFLNFGRGFTTRPARNQANQPSLFPSSVTGLEIGSRWSGLGNKLSLGGGLWWMHKDQETIFDSEAGLSIPQGQSHRLGVEIELRYAPISWAYLATDFSYIHARVDRNSTWTTIPNTPSVLITNVLGVRHSSGLNATIRGRLLGPREHDLGYRSPAYYIVDLILAYELGRFVITAQIDNLFDSNWYDSVFAYPVRLSPGGSVVEGLQVTPGTPFAARIAMTIHL
jgi:outer membrane receptor for monomeric catechols